MEKYDVTYKNELVGEAEISEDGLFTVLRVSCAAMGGVMRLYGRAGDGYHPIGILTPVGNRMRLVKKYSRNDLQSLPLGEMTAFELYSADREPTPPEPEPAPEPIQKPTNEPQPEQPVSIWTAISDPAGLFADEELKMTASSIKGGMTARDEDATLLAIPISTDAPFPLMPVFRYGWSAMVEGKCCIVFRVKDGKLV